MVPDEGIEPPTFGLQNRCTTAVLIRPLAFKACAVVAIVFAGFQSGVDLRGWRGEHD